MEIEKKSIAAFYDAHSERMLRDFVNGNARVSAAIDLVTTHLHGRNGKILDVGCGIGSASYLFAQKLTGFEVLGVDISPKSIEIGRKLFSGDRVSLAVSDMECSPEDGPFDAIVLVDVYEHIPREKWPDFNRVLASSLTPDGMLILTTPSSLHQSYLKECKPEGLQIVDETVEVSDVMSLARDLDATLVHYSMKSIWQTNDYLHVVIERCPQYSPKVKSHQRKLTVNQRLRRKMRHLSGMSQEPVGVKERRCYVKERLGVDVK
ncbi:SAM-dependent methyltransferase [Allorhodopirellula solitaria]|uniref:Cyclopropane-fatty-acyl-phospholipid synthase n=1 Tax=Allorhodopirellula solitaria TaxID=2527987 RepID=A0A5C5X0X6_9BACT|nr:class I SAM-dependent methyltransferase [Allorhodopirellula solitaria]TWT55862.1 Cyclopropane-fatty-acyl-phospholipid synthase [Allorhodopirellula solitaria]